MIQNGQIAPSSLAPRFTHASRIYLRHTVAPPSIIIHRSNTALALTWSALLDVHATVAHSKPMLPSNTSFYSGLLRHHTEITYPQHRLIERETRVRRKKASNGILVSGRGVRAAIDSSTVASAQEPLSRTPRAVSSGPLPVSSMGKVTFLYTASVQQLGPEFVSDLTSGLCKHRLHAKLSPRIATDPTATQADLTLSPDATIRECPLIRSTCAALSSEDRTASCF